MIRTNVLTKLDQSLDHQELGSLTPHAMPYVNLKGLKVRTLVTIFQVAFLYTYFMYVHLFYFACP